MPDPANFNLSVRKISNLILVFGFAFIVLLFPSNSTSRPKENLEPKLNTPTATFTDHCTNDKSYACYKAALTGYLNKNGIADSVSTLETLGQQNETVKFFCHSLAHDLGRQAYEMTRGNIGTVFREGSTVCWSGLYHGALERVFGESADLVKTAQTLCTKDNGVEGSFLYYQCLHGLGHGLSARFDNEIYDALAVCKQLRDDYQQRSCYGGVFMENYAADGVNHQAKYLDSADPIAPCNKVDQIYKYNCYQLVSIQILKLNSYDFGQAFKTCENSDLGFELVCYQSVGRDISGYTAEDPDQSLKYCALGKLEAERECVKSIASDSVYSKSSENFVNGICNLVKSSLKVDCYTSAADAISVLYDNKKQQQQACAVMDRNYIKVCEQAL